MDGTDFSTLAYKKDTPKFKEGMAKYRDLKEKGFNNAFLFNGGIGEKQLKWLEK